jgi:hypothetical protein
MLFAVAQIEEVRDTHAQARHAAACVADDQHRRQRRIALRAAETIDVLSREARFFGKRFRLDVVPLDEAVETRSLRPEFATASLRRFPHAGSCGTSEQNA